MPPEKKVESAFLLPHEWPTAATVARDLMAQVEAIDAELARVEG